MTVLDQVREFVVQRSPEFVCDDCIANKLGLSVRQHANQKTRELEKMRGFDRRKAGCSICQSDKLVIRHA